MDERRNIIRLLMDTFGMDEWRRWGPGNGDDFHNWALEQRISFMRVDTRIHLLDYLWPNFVEIDGYVLRETITYRWTRDELSSLLNGYQTLPPPGTMEFLCNHMHVRDEYSYAPSKDFIDMQVWQYLAETITSMWRSRLANLFPEKYFDVVAWNGGGIGDWQVSATMIRNDTIPACKANP